MNKVFKLTPEQYGLISILKTLICRKFARIYLLIDIDGQMCRYDN